TLHAPESSIGLGDSDQRRIDDCAPHRFAARAYVRQERGRQDMKERSMAATAPQTGEKERTASPWQGFRTGLWQKEIDVRDFIQQNYEPYDGDGSFLTPATARTQRIWKTLQELFVEERRKGVLDISQIPASITAHPPGYIDRENEIIV